MWDTVCGIAYQRAINVMYTISCCKCNTHSAPGSPSTPDGGVVAWWRSGLGRWSSNSGNTGSIPTQGVQEM